MTGVHHRHRSERIPVGANRIVNVSGSDRRQAESRLVSDGERSHLEESVSPVGGRGAGGGSALRQRKEKGRFAAVVVHNKLTTD